jgi:uncharacterized membrane protein
VTPVLVRFGIYGVLGWAVEILWTALGSTLSGRQRGWRLAGTPYLWMFPIYGLLAPLYEPAHDALRGRPRPLRALLYGIGFLSVEYLAGRLIRGLTGTCPWDYSGRARWHVHGLIRLDYAPAWAALGLLLEPVHDLLVQLMPHLHDLLRRKEPTGRDHHQEIEQEYR